MNRSTWDHGIYLHDAALGALLGACVGDAAGAVLEFMDRPSSEQARRAMTLPGGGIWEVAPGQITDDGELTIAQARGLAESGTFDIEAIARSYADWIDSGPFDIGGTIARSIGSVYDPERGECARRMAAVAADECMASKANGSLMRSTPLGVWGHRLSDDELALIARADSALSHPNPSCRDAVACYAIAVASLMNDPGNRERAFERAMRWGRSNATDEVTAWLTDAEADLDLPYEPMAGFVRIAFTHAFRHLLRGSDYETALLATLAGGGDTDTNACIVGGLIGASCGAEGIPGEMREAVLGCDTLMGSHVRPFRMRAGNIPTLVERLLTVAPARLEESTG